MFLSFAQVDAGDQGKAGFAKFIAVKLVGGYIASSDCVDGDAVCLRMTLCLGETCAALITDQLRGEGGGGGGRRLRRGCGSSHCGFCQ